VDVRRLGADESNLALDALRLLKAPDGYPTPAPEYLAQFLSRPDNVLIVATTDGVPVGSSWRTCSTVPIAISR
jgi:hypothetical protein